MDFRTWLHNLSGARISAYQFSYFTLSPSNALWGLHLTYNEFLYRKYLRWCKRRGITPTGGVEDLEGPSLGPN